MGKRKKDNKEEIKKKTFPKIDGGEKEKKTHALSINQSIKTRLDTTQIHFPQRPSRSALHLSELEVVLGPRAWAHAEEELRIRRENAVEDDEDVDGDGDRRHRGGDASTSTSTSSSFAPPSSAYCVLWCWSRADSDWRWLYTSEAVQPLLHRRRGRRRAAEGGGGGSKKNGSGGGGGGNNNGNSLFLSWSPLDLGR